MRIKAWISWGLLTLLLLAVSASAALAATDQVDLSLYRRVIKLTPPQWQPNLTQPKVVEVILPDRTLDKNQVLVWNQTKQAIEPYQVKTQTSAISWSVIDLTNDQWLPQLSDQRSDTYQDYFVPPSTASQTLKLELRYDQTVHATGLQLKFRPNSALPQNISLSLLHPNGKQQLILNRVKTTGSILRFPTITGRSWLVELNYDQLLSLADVGLVITESGKRDPSLHIWFLARPGEQYLIYLDPEVKPSLPYLSTGRYTQEANPIRIPGPPVRPNPFYRPFDTDKDGIPDKQDNCPSVPNPDQVDDNHNRTGDVCEDYDYDGIINAKDNCPDVPNPLQQDKDNDGIGDHCDEVESRLTERLQWLPWLAIGFSLVVVIWLLRSTSLQAKANQTPSSQSDPDSANNSSSLTKQTSQRAANKSD